MSAAPEVAPRLYKAEDLDRVCREGYRYELVRGVLYEMSLAGAKHGSVGERLAARLSVFVDDHDLGTPFMAETGFILERDPDTVRGPDWSFVAKHRLPAEIPDRRLELVPDAVLEVRSPDTTRREAEERIQDWLRVGARLVWDMDPRRRTLTVWRQHQEPRTLGPDDVVTGEDVIPGFSLPLSRVFR